MKKLFLSFFLFMMVSIVVWNFVSPPIIEKLVEDHIGQQLDQYCRKLVKGMYHLVLKDLHELPPGRWDRYIESVKPKFGYPISLDNINELELPDEDLNQLMAGRIIVKREGNLFYQRVGQNNQVVTMGTIPDFDTPLRLQIAVWTAVVINFGIMALIWVLPFWLKLRKISVATEAFGRGEFNVRAQLPKRSSLSQLAQSFNNMAKRIQQLIDSHKELTRAVSHELRTPISRIRFSLEMIDTAHNVKDWRQYVSEIHKDVDELDTLISELLIYSRFDRETPDLELREQAIVPWLFEVAKTAEKGFADTTFEHSISQDNQNLTVWLEPLFMGRAVTNLIRNAAKYATSRVHVIFEKEDTHCLIHVDDDGPGIPSKNHKQIFKPFVRLDSSRSRDTGGYGLGLAIVQRVVSWHGGEVLIDQSTLGGARFTIRWRCLSTGTKTDSSKIIHN